MTNVLLLIISDWKRYLNLHKKINLLLVFVIFFRNPGMFFSLIFRIENSLLYNKFLMLRILGSLFYPFYFIITYYILDIDIPPDVKIGPGLYVHNRGIIFTSFVIAGENLSLIGPLTVGVKGFGEKGTGRPQIGNYVTIFTGARVIGPIKIGNHVYVGANAVVVKNVPSLSIVGGIPAKIIKRIKESDK